MEIHSLESSFVYVPKGAKERKWYVAEGQNMEASHGSRTAVLVSSEV